MKKSILTVIILAMCVINLVLNAIMMFAVVPSANKTNKLISQVCEALDLNLEVKTDDGSVSFNELDFVTLTDSQTINLKSSANSDKRYAVLTVTLQLNTTSKDYTDLKTKITGGEEADTSVQNVIWNEVRNVVSSYTVDEASSISKQEEMQQQILERLQEYFASKTIYGVSFGKFIFQ